MTDLPYSQEAEEAVLSAVFIDPDVYANAAQILQPDDFYVRRNRWLWEAYTNLIANGTPIDTVTLCDELENNGRLSDFGGAAKITALMNTATSSMNADAYAEIVHSDGVRRRLIASAGKVATLAYNSSIPITDVVARSAEAIQFAANGVTARNAVATSEAAGEYYDWVTANSQKSDTELGINTGLADLDRLLGYGIPNKFIVLAGRPGAGKTSLALNFIRSASMLQSRPSCIFTMEMSRKQIMNALVSIHTELDNRRLAGGRLDEDEWPPFNDAIALLEKSPIMIDDSTRLSVATIRARATALRSQNKLDLLVIDYILLIGGGDAKQKEYERVNALSRELKLLQHELQIPVIAIHQQNRAATSRADKKPSQEDLREGGEMDADIVAFVWEPGDVITEKFLPRRITIAKHRDGPIGEVETVFKGWCTRFESAEIETRDFTR